MDIHKNARLTLILRAEMVKVVLEEGCTLKRAAARFNVSAKTAAKWVRHSFNRIPAISSSTPPSPFPRTAYLYLIGTGRAKIAGTNQGRRI